MIDRFPFLHALHAATMFEGARCRAITAAVLLAAAQTCAAQTSTGGTAAASAPAVASASAATAAVPAGASQVTVQAGQSLHDIAVGATQSHDRAVLARAAKAIFDANPSAFMKNDPSRMKIGAVLNVPALDATGAAVEVASAGAAAGASATTAAAGGTAASGPTPAMAGNAASSAAAGSVATAAAGANASATQATREQAAAAAAGSATGAATATPSATAGNAASSASAPAAGASASNAASAPANATAATAATAGTVGTAAAVPASAPSASASASAPATGVSNSQAAAASSGNVWSGSIQSAPSQPVAGASGAQTASAGAPQGASQARTQVSSLQQLLALKNRVLMELQKHGIGKSQTASGVAATNGQPSAGASGAVSAPALAARPPAASASPQQPALTLTSKQEYVGAAALIGALLAAVVAGLAMRRRKRIDTPAVHARSGAGLSAPDDGAQSTEPPASNDASRSAANAYDVMAKRSESAAKHEPPSSPFDADDVPPLTERVLPPAESGVASRPFGTLDIPAQQPAKPSAAFDAAAAEHDRQSDLTHEAQAFDHHDDHAGDQTSAIEPPAAPADALAREAHPLDEAGTEAEAEAEAEGQGIEPVTPAEITEPTEPTPELPPDVAAPATDAEHAAAAEDIDGIPTLAEPLPAEPAAAATDTAAQTEAHAESLGEQQPPTSRYAQEPAAEEEPAATAEQDHETHAAAPQFPRAALAALGSLDMSLPPRAAESAGPVTPPASLTTQPVVEPEITAQQAVPPNEPQPPRVGEQIEAGTAGHGAIAGMGAARYGPLALDFDLELPPGPAQPLPTFTPEELARIARNKLELAAEYIELGDVAGARTLINEVIESNDAATRNEARAMLSTLAPLS